MQNVYILLYIKLASDDNDNGTEKQNNAEEAIFIKGFPLRFCFLPQPMNNAFRTNSISFSIFCRLSKFFFSKRKLRKIYSIFSSFWRKEV